MTSNVFSLRSLLLFVASTMGVRLRCQCCVSACVCVCVRCCNLFSQVLWQPNLAASVCHYHLKRALVLMRRQNIQHILLATHHSKQFTIHSVPSMLYADFCFCVGLNVAINGFYPPRCLCHSTLSFNSYIRHHMIFSLPTSTEPSTSIYT